jgi:hypothetical protein
MEMDGEWEMVSVGRPVEARGKGLPKYQTQQFQFPVNLLVGSWAVNASLVSLVNGSLQLGYAYADRRVLACGMTRPILGL